MMADPTHRSKCGENHMATDSQSLHPESDEPPQSENAVISTPESADVALSQVLSHTLIATDDIPGIILDDNNSIISPILDKSLSLPDTNGLNNGHGDTINDSGIAMCMSMNAEQSADKLVTDDESEETKTESKIEVNASGDGEMTDNPSTSNGAGCMQCVGDAGDNNVETCALGCANSSTDSDDNSSQSIHQMEQELENVLRRRGCISVINRRLRSDSDSDDDDDDDDSNEVSMDHDQSKDSSDDDMELDLQMPPDPWRPVCEFRQREMGYGNCIPTAELFSNRCGSSLNFVQKLQIFSKLEKHEGCVNALHFNETGSLLASGSDDLNIVVWKWMLKKPFFSFESGHRSNVFQSKFMPYTGDTHIVSCARDGQIRLAELSSTGTCKDTKRLTQHRGAAHKLALLQDSSHVFYSCGEDAVTYEIDLRAEKPHKLSTTKENTKKVPLYSIHANPSKSHEYCVSGRDHFVRIFDKRMASEEDNSGLLKKFCPSHLQGAMENDIKANVTCAVYSYDGQEIIGSYNDEDIYLFDNTHSDGAGAIHRYRGHRNNATVKGVNFYGPKSEYIITGSDCGNIFIWDKKTEKIVHYFSGDDSGVVNVLEPHPEFPILATSGLDHDVKVWMPTAFEPTKLRGLASVMKRNKQERDEERLDPSEAIDSSTFWRLMQHFRRTARRRARQEGEDISTESEDSGDSDDEDEDGEHGDPIECAPS